MMKKFLLVGHGGCCNRGCEAILRSTITMLDKEFRQPKITISSFDYENDKLVNLGPNIEFIQSKKQWDRWTGQWLIRQTRKIFSKEYRKSYWEVEFSSILSAAEEADVVLSVGGDNYTNDYGHGLHFLNLNRFIKKQGRKLVIWGASIGPFHDCGNLQCICENLQKVDLITVRETETREYLKSIGVSENVKLVADPAFILSVDNNISEDIFHDITREIVGFNISPILSKYSDGITEDEIISESVMFLRKIIDKYRFHILLIPHVTNPNGRNNDFNFMEKIYDGLLDTGNISRVSSSYNAMQMKYIISKCRFFIGARTHSTIAALSTGVPTLSLGYSLKSKGINKDIFGNYDFLLSVKELSTDSLFSKFEKMKNDESKIRRILSEKIPVVKKAAWDNIRYLKEIV